MSFVDFTGLNLDDTFVALRARAAFVRGDWQGMYHRSRECFSSEQIKGTIGSGWVDRIDGGGVIIKTSFTNFPLLDPYCYDRDNGAGAMQAVRDFLLSVRSPAVSS